MARADTARHTEAALQSAGLGCRDVGDDRIAGALRALDQEGISGLADLWQAMLAKLSTKKHGAAASTLAAPPDQGAGAVRTGDGVLVSSKMPGPGGTHPSLS